MLRISRALWDGGCEKLPDDRGEKADEPDEARRSVGEESGEADETPSSWRASRRSSCKRLLWPSI
jgi:hypothetical protein